MTSIHAWSVRVVRLHRTVSTGKKAQGARPLAITQYQCDCCGATTPEHITPLPWWTQPGPWTSCADALRGAV